MKLLNHLNAFLGAAPDEQDSLVLPLVHINLIIYSCAFWMQQPVIPEKIKSLAASEVEYGTLQSSSAILALLGSTYMGRVVDVYGARTGLMLAQCASGLLYLISGLATSFTQLYFTAFPAFFQHAMLCCSAAIAALSSDSRRVIALGRLGLSYGIGMALGSPLGGLLAQEFGIQAAFFSAAAAAFIVALFDFVALPPLRSSNVQPKGNNGLNMGAVWRVATSSRVVLNLLVLSFSSGLATNCFRSMFALAAVEEFGLTSQDLGFLMSFMAFMGLITNVFLIGWIVNSLGETRTLVLSLFAQGLAFIGIFLVSHLPDTLVMISVPQSVASTLFYTLGSSMLTKSVPPQDQGTVASLGHAMRSLTQVLAPLLGGFIMRRHHFGGVGLFAAIVTLSGALYALIVFRDSVIVAQDNEQIAMKEEKTRVE